MTVWEHWLRAFERELDFLRESLEDRRRGLCAALQLYECTTIEAIPRMALALRTQAAIADVDDALHRVSESTFAT
jgi:hypothetical protein